LEVFIVGGPLVKAKTQVYARPTSRKITVRRLPTWVRKYDTVDRRVLVGNASLTIATDNVAKQQSPRFVSPRQAPAQKSGSAQRTAGHGRIADTAAVDSNRIERLGLGVQCKLTLDQNAVSTTLNLHRRSASKASHKETHVNKAKTADFRRN